MKKILVSAIIALITAMPASTVFITSLSVGSDILLVDDVSEWTVMFYFDGDQSTTTYSLSDKMLADLSNLESIGSIEDVNFIVLMDLDGVNDSNLYYVIKNDIVEIPLTLVNSSWDKELNMGAEDTLIDFMRWSIENFPAEHYNIYLNNHGGGWYGICADENPYHDVLNLVELKHAFSTTARQIEGKIDVVSMDACLMSTVEVAYQLKNDINYLVASESFIHTHKENGELFLNWAVDEIYGSLASHPYMTAEELCIESVVDFKTDKAFILLPTIVKPQAVDCIGAIDVSKIDDIVLAADEMADRLLSKHLFFRLFLPRIFLKTQSFSGGFDFIGLTYYPFIDLYDFSNNVRRVFLDKKIRDSAENVMHAIEGAIVAERHGVSRIRWEHVDAHGLSIYLPYRKSVYDSRYDSLDFARDTHWDEFVKKCWILHL